MCGNAVHLKLIGILNHFLDTLIKQGQTEKEVNVIENNVLCGEIIVIIQKQAVMHTVLLPQIPFILVLSMQAQIHI